MLPKVGESASIKESVTDRDVRTFAELVGDNNPLHTDDAFAAKTRFGRRIVHGMFCAALISRVLGTRLPGPGTIYLSQSLEFVAPVFPEEEVTARVTVVEVREEKRIVRLETECRNGSGQTVVRGEAVVLVEEIE